MYVCRADLPVEKGHPVPAQYMYHEGIFLHYEGPLLAPDITRFLMMKMKSDIQSKLYEHKET